MEVRGEVGEIGWDVRRGWERVALHSLGEGAARVSEMEAV